MPFSQSSFCWLANCNLKAICSYPIVEVATLSSFHLDYVRVPHPRPHTNVLASVSPHVKRGRWTCLRKTPSAWGWLSPVSGSLLGCQRRPLVAILVHATWERVWLSAWLSECFCVDVRECACVLGVVHRGCVTGL